MTIDLDRIANLAEMASGSPNGDVVYIGQDPPGAASDARAELIAALSPDVVLRLVAVCRAASNPALHGSTAPFGSPPHLAQLALKAALAGLGGEA